MILEISEEWEDVEEHPKVDYIWLDTCHRLQCRIFVSFFPENIHFQAEKVQQGHFCSF